LILVARPLAVLPVLMAFRFNWREQLYISWVGLRGAVPIVLSLFPMLAGIENAQVMFNVAFFIVLVSLIVQGGTVAPAARLLKLDVRGKPQARQRVELDVPGQSNYEVVGYTLEPDSALAGRMLVSLPLPGSARLIGVIRRGVLAPKANRLRLRIGDTVYLIAPFKAIEQLDRVFLASAHRDGLLAEAFEVSGQAPLADLLGLLGADSDAIQPGDTLTQWFARRFGSIVEGTWLAVGDYRISVQKMDGEKVAWAKV